MKKLKYVGNKAGGVRGWELLEGAGLGTIIESRAARGTDKVTCMLYGSENHQSKQ